MRKPWQHRDPLRGELNPHPSEAVDILEILQGKEGLTAANLWDNIRTALENHPNLFQGVDIQIAPSDPANPSRFGLRATMFLKDFRQGDILLENSEFVIREDGVTPGVEFSYTSADGENIMMSTTPVFEDPIFHDTELSPIDLRELERIDDKDYRQTLALHAGIVLQAVLDPLKPI